jgi:periplasmic protein TonB
MRAHSWPSENIVIGSSVMLAVGLHVVFLLLVSDILKPDMIETNISAHRVSVVERPAESMPLPQESQKSEEPQQEKTKAAPSKVVPETTSQSVPELAAVSVPVPMPTPTPTPTPKPAPAPKPVPSLEPSSKPSIEPKESVEQQAQVDPELKAEPEKLEAPSQQTARSEPSQGSEQAAKIIEASTARLTESEQAEQVIAPSFKQGSPQNPDPEYPSLARRRGWEGDVVLGVHIDEAGGVTYVEILKTSDVSALDFAAYTTVKNEWRFDPARHGEQAVKGYVTVPISFRLK